MSLRRSVPAVAAAVALVAAGAGSATSPTERVVLKPVAGAHLSASAIVGAAGSGTRVAFTVFGTRPHADLRAILNAGTCKTRSASFATAGGTRADTRGLAVWTTMLRFHGANVRWSTVSDGAHVLVVIIDSKTAACGTIPGIK